MEMLWLIGDVVVAYLEMWWLIDRYVRWLIGGDVGAHWSEMWWLIICTVVAHQTSGAEVQG